MIQNKLIGIDHRLDCNNDNVEIVAIGDLHLGDGNCNIKLISDLIDSVKTKQNRYAVLTGDIMNTAIVGSKSDIYSERINPQEQLEAAVELFKPISDKILAIVPGNHEERITRTSGVDMTRTMAQLLGCEKVYSATSALMVVRFGFVYSFYINHGHGGGGRRAGSKVNGLEDMAQIIDVDCYIVGHTHLPAVFKRQTYRLVPGKSVAKLHEQLFVNTASALNYGGYGNRNGYVPGSNSYPVIVLDHTEHKLTATV